MKRNIVHDERVLAQRRKINSEANEILMVMLLASILIQQFFFNATFKEYATEFICFFGASIYMTIRYFMLGINLYGDGSRPKKLALASSLVTGAAITVVNGVINYTQFSPHYKQDGIWLFVAMLAITFISASVMTFIVISFVGYLNNKKQAAIIKKLEDDEQDY